MLVSKLTPNLEFKGILKDDEILRERISEDSGTNMEKMYLALQRMKNVDDGKIYRYLEKTVDADLIGCYHYDTYASIVDNKGKTQNSILISSWDEFEGTKNVSTNFISKLICDFVDEKYPSQTNSSNIKKKIFDILG